MLASWQIAAKFLRLLRVNICLSDRKRSGWALECVMNSSSRLNSPERKMQMRREIIKVRANVQFDAGFLPVIKL
jgi:hypothetical protein